MANNGLEITTENQTDSLINESIPEVDIMEEYDYPCLSGAVDDTLIVEFKADGFCLNHNLDSLISARPSYDLKLVDLTHNLVLITWSPFLGMIKTEKVKENVYAFSGSAKFPVNGNWDAPFQDRDILRYVLEIEENRYLFYRDKKVRLSLKSNPNKLEKVREDVFNDSTCLSEDWDVANLCFDRIELYEYELFASALSGNKSDIGEYMNLRRDISIVNAGAFSEYLAGNQMLLSLYGLTDLSGFEKEALTHIYGIGDQQFCYGKP